MVKKITKKKTDKKDDSTRYKREKLLSKQESLLFLYYFIAGIVLGILLLLIFKVPIIKTFSKFYGFLYMFFIPGLFMFRAIFKHKVFKTPLEEYGYPVLISWGVHSLFIAGISGFFKTPITDLNLYGSSFVLIIISIIIFYARKT
ncbi:MAG: hypothetical protein KJ583_01545 [Nanoarchaeota archaeon]|nr:hypothetical protein [Nanoarchaeota archaeon]MBU1269998.1 hypothetical protein [Nanoarchaeota archaeon]MBU1603977.1 hypothetical protein [Nanoarchaeota archaeon]